VEKTRPDLLVRMFAPGKKGMIKPMNRILYER